MFLHKFQLLKDNDNFFFALFITDNLFLSAILRIITTQLLEISHAILKLTTSHIIITTKHDLLHMIITYYLHRLTNIIHNTFFLGKSGGCDC